VRGDEDVAVVRGKGYAASMTFPASQGNPVSVWVPGRLYRAGVICLLVAAVPTGMRLALRHAWRPQDLGSALGFIVGELLLLPAGTLLLAMGAAWEVGGRGARPGRVGLALGQRRAPWVPRLMVAIALACAGVFCCLSVPAVSRHWGWGRFGLGPPVPVRSLNEVSDVTCLTFPKGSVLRYGEYDRLLEQHLRATITIPRDRVDEFLRQQIISRGSTSESERWVEDEPWTRAGGARWPPGLWKPDSARRFLSGASDYHGYLAWWSWLISLDDPYEAVLYLVYWDKGPGNAQAAVAEFRTEARDRQRGAGPQKALPGTAARTSE
jgi:hypothetical protein